MPAAAVAIDVVVVCCCLCCYPASSVGLSNSNKDLPESSWSDSSWGKRGENDNKKLND